MALIVHPSFVARLEDFDENEVRRWMSAFDPGAPAAFPAAVLETINALQAGVPADAACAGQLIAAIREWLGRQPRHPFLQFQALTALKRLGAVGWVRLPPQGRRDVRLRIERTPLSPDEHPTVIREVPELVRAACEADCSLLADLAADAWRDFVAIAYATDVYPDIVRDGKRGLTPAWSAALHAAVALSAGWPFDLDRLMDTYGVGEPMKPVFRRAFCAVRDAFGLLAKRPSSVL